MSLPGKQEVERNVKGAFQLLLQRPEGLNVLDASVTGFWRSFYAALYGAPFFIYIMYSSIGAVEGGADLPESARVLTQIGINLPNTLALLLIYVIGWLYWPLLFHYLSNAFGLEERYLRYIVAYNWAALIQIAFAAVALFLAAFLLGAPGGLLILASIVLQFFFQWSVARLALEIPGMAAAGLVFLDFIVGRAVLWAGLAMIG